MLGKYKDLCRSIFLLEDKLDNDFSIESVTDRLGVFPTFIRSS